MSERTTTPMAPHKRGHLVLDGWGGISYQLVEVIGETPKRFRCVALTTTRLAGRRGYVLTGETFLVPKRAVIFGRTDGPR